MCKTAKTVHAIEAEECYESSEPWFLGTVEAGQDAWTMELFIKHHKVNFLIDTGADVTVIPESTFREIKKGHCLWKRQTSHHWGQVAVHSL